MSKSVMELSQKQIDALKEDLKADSYTLKELASKYGVEYSSLMYWMQRNRISYNLKLNNGKSVSSDDQQEEVTEVKEEPKKEVSDDLRFKIVKDTIIGEKPNSIATKYSLQTQDVIYELQHNCVQADMQLIRDNIDTSRKDTIRLNTIAYIIANPQKTRVDFRKDNKYPYNYILQSIYFLVNLGILQKSDFVPSIIANRFTRTFDENEQYTFIEAIYEGMQKDEVANMFGIEVYEVDKILQSKEFTSRYDIYKSTKESNQNEENKHEKEKSIEKLDEPINKNVTSNKIDDLEKKLKIKTLEIDKLKLEIKLKSLEEELKSIQKSIQETKKSISSIDDEIRNI